MSSFVFTDLCPITSFSFLKYCWTHLALKTGAFLLPSLSNSVPLFHLLKMLVARASVWFLKQTFLNGWCSKHNLMVASWTVSELPTHWLWTHTSRTGLCNPGSLFSHRQNRSLWHDLWASGQVRNHWEMIRSIEVLGNGFAFHQTCSQGHSVKRLRWKSLSSGCMLQGTPRKCRAVYFAWLLQVTAMQLLKEIYTW